MKQEMRTQLEQLRIQRDKRPVVGRRSAGRRWTIIAAVIAVVVLLTGYAARDRVTRAFDGGAGAKAMTLITVRSQPNPGPGSVLTATGKIVSDHLVEVATKVSGQIVALLFEQGDTVEQDQILARLEDVNYRALRDEAAAELEKSRAALEYQKVNFARIETLYKRTDAPEIEFADARRALDEAQAQIDADSAALAFTQKALDDCVVRSPISGVVLERNVEVGDFVAAEGGLGANANAQFAAIADMTKLRVEVDISELDIARLRRGMPCTITPDAYKDRRYAGFVMWIDPGANYSKATVQVKVRIDNPEPGRLRVDGSAKVVFLENAPDTDAAERPGLWIPRTACQIGDDGDDGDVFVATDGRLRRTHVAIGGRTPDQLLIVDGLREGQQIVRDGLDNLTDGQRLPRRAS
ncbi:MAG: efflux RND transporter periplasmic adaptor subunit [Phycisphaerae bacterium]